MGFVFINVKVESLAEPPRGIELEMLVDTGAIQPMIPRRILDGLGIVPVGEKQFILADGQRTRLQIGEARFWVGGESTPAAVVFGPEESKPLLGVVVLESLGLRVDSRTGELEKTDLLLLHASTSAALVSNHSM